MSPWAVCAKICGLFFINVTLKYVVPLSEFADRFSSRASKYNWAQPHARAEKLLAVCYESGVTCRRQLFSFISSCVN